MTTEDERVRVSLEKDAETHVARITIDNPERKNAWDPEMRRQMGTFLDEVATDDDIKVVILRGAGGVFSTGADMNNAYNWYGPGDTQAPAEPAPPPRRRSPDLQLLPRVPQLSEGDDRAGRDVRARWCLRARVDVRPRGGRP